MVKCIQADDNLLQISFGTLQKKRFRIMGVRFILRVCLIAGER